MTFDAIVLGGGIVGCAIAFSLARAGHRVAIVEKGEIGAGTTANSFAWANATSKAMADAHYHALNAAGVAAWGALASEFGTDAPGLRQTGSLLIARKSETAAFNAMHEQAEALHQRGQDCRILTADELRAAEPDLTLPGDAEALLAPDDMVVDGPRVARFFARTVEERGGTVLAHTAARELVANEAGVVSGVLTDSGPLSAPALIVAAGPDTPQVLSDLTGYEGFAARFPMRRVPGLLLTTPPLADGIGPRHVVGFSSDRELHMLPAPGGGIKIGSDDIDGMIHDDQSEAAMLRGGEALLQRAAEYLPALAESVDVRDCQIGVGVRPYPEDGVTIAGPLPGAEGLFVVATHSGVTLAPELGRLVAEYVVTGEAPAALHPYRLDRFAGFAV